MSLEKKQEKKMLLEQFYNLSVQIGELFEKHDFEETQRLISRKDKIIALISQLKEIKVEQLSELIEKIKNQEEKNIAFAQKLKNEISAELDKLNKNVKMANIYGNSAQKGSIVDILE